MYFRIKSLMILFLVCLFPMILPAEEISGEEQPLHLVILLDASASMKKTDPKGIRKLAAQAVISLLSEKDKVAVLEFDSDARILSDWMRASAKQTLFEAIDKSSDNGAFTDFCSGLEKAAKLFKKDHSQSRKVILLLSDGIFEPNLYSARYAPYHLKYKVAIAGKGRNRRKEITKQFRQKLAPIGKRIIESDVLQQLGQNKIEIFSIAFSPNADRNLMTHLAEASSLFPEEMHSFYAENATDLMGSFLRLLHYWENMITLYSDKGSISLNDKRKVFIDQYIVKPLAILLTQEKVNFVIKGGGTEREDSLPDTHPNLQIIPLKKTSLPSNLEYWFKEGKGAYRLLIVGKSSIELRVKNLQDKYLFGKPIKSVVNLAVEGKDASFLYGSSSISAEFVSEGNEREYTTLEKKHDGFVLDYKPDQAGRYRLKFTAHIKNSSGKELLPRPSVTYKLQVMPRIFIEPDKINFGRMSKAQQKERVVTIHYGLRQKATITIKGKVTEASRCVGASEKLPQIEPREISIDPGEVKQIKLTLLVPKNGCWGDFAGAIDFRKNNNAVYKISYMVHIPSILEKLTIPVIIVFIILLAAIIYFVSMWGRLGHPVGVIRFIKTPPGELRSDISLGKLGKGFFKSIFNWKKNIVILGPSSAADIKLPSLSSGYKIELRFYRIGSSYISNRSDPGTESDIKIVDPILEKTVIQRKPGEIYYLKKNMKIIIEDYTLKYERM